MALGITGARPSKEKSVALAHPLPVVSESHLTDKDSFVNDVGLSGKCKGAMCLMEADDGTLSVVVAQGEGSEDRWVSLDPSVKVLPDNVAAQTISASGPRNMTVKVDGGSSTPTTFTVEGMGAGHLKVRMYVEVTAGSGTPSILFKPVTLRPMSGKYAVSSSGLPLDTGKHLVTAETFDGGATWLVYRNLK